MNENNSFLKLAAARYSVRKFTDTPIEKDVMDSILRAGHLAPTGCNFQPQRILVLQTAEEMEKLRRCTKCHFGAPAALLVCFDKTACWTRKYDGKQSGDIDAAIVTTHMMLEAYARGVGSCWVMHFIPEAVRAEFDLPEAYEPTALLVLGYPAPDAAPSPLHNAFQPMEETVFYGAFPSSNEKD